MVLQDEDDEDTIVACVLADADDEIALAVATSLKAARRRSSSRRGSTPGRKKTRERNIQLGHESIMRDYLGPDPIYDESLFQRRYGIPSELFRTLLGGITSASLYFRMRPDAVGKMGASPEQKITAALRMLVNGTSADAQDEYCRLAESTVMESFHAFCKTVVDVYGAVYLRSPTPDDVDKILQVNKDRGMPGLLGSLDCTHWRWKNCPTAWHGHYRGKEGAPTIVLEAVAYADRWIWHAFFGIPGSNNDLNILDRSPLLHSFLNDTCPRASYEIAGTIHDTPYYFVDGIYPPWGTFVSAYVEPTERSKKAFTQAHEAIRKDVECAFGILKARFAVLSIPSRLWYHEQMKYVIYCCIILHNMVIELRGQGGHDFIQDPYGTEAAGLQHCEQGIALRAGTDSSLDECFDGSILALCRRLSLL